MKNIIEKEINELLVVLKHPAGFDIDMGGLLCIRPTDECCPPETWEVDWEDWDNNKHYANFDNLLDAVEFFVKKRHELEYGLDYDK